MAIYRSKDFEMQLVDLIIELERDPNGVLSDFVAHFKSRFINLDQYINAISGEFVYWFDESSLMKPIAEELQKTGMIEAFVPNLDYDNQDLNLLLGELTRFHNSLTAMKEDYLLIYIAPPLVEDIGAYVQFFETILDIGLSPKVRFIVLENEAEPVFENLIRLHQKKIKVIESKLELAEAVKEAAKPTGSPEKPVNKYRLLLHEIMEAASKNDAATVKKLVPTFIQTAAILGDISNKLACYLIICQAFYLLKDMDKTLLYADKLISNSEKDISDLAIYTIWHAGMMLKAAVYIHRKDSEKALEIYNITSNEAVAHHQSIHAMEGFRMQARLHLDKKNIEEAWEKCLLGLSVAEYLPKEQQKQFSSLYLGKIAVHIATEHKSKAVQKELDENLLELLGKNWQKGLQKRN